MKVLVCALQAPWPPKWGVDLRCWQILNLLAGIGEVGLFALTGTGGAPPGFPAKVWHIASSAASITARASDANDSSWLAREDGLPSDAYYDLTAVQELRILLEQFAPDVVVLDQLWLHRYREVVQSTGVRLILNTHNVEGKLARDVEAHETYLPVKLMRRRLADRATRVEREFVHGADQTWVCSELDRERIFAEYGGEDDLRALVHVVPNAIDTDRYRPSMDGRIACPPEFAGLRGPVFLFAGVFHYPPNVNAAHFLMRALFPRLQLRYPEARLMLAGANPPPAMRQESSANPAITITGQVSDMAPYLQHSSMMLAPLFEGGGTRFKILEAFAAQLPVVSSTKGAEGLGVVGGQHLLLADTTDAFMDAVEETLTKPSETELRVRCAATLVEAFSWTAVRETVVRALAELKPSS